MVIKSPITIRHRQISLLGSCEPQTPSPSSYSKWNLHIRAAHLIEHPQMTHLSVLRKSNNVRLSVQLYDLDSDELQYYRKVANAKPLQNNLSDQIKKSYQKNY